MSDVYLPASLDELWSHLERTPRPSVYAGGTDLLVRVRRGMADPCALVCLERIEALKGVCDHGERIRIGSITTHAALLADCLIGEHFPVLAQALRALGSPLIRNMGTIGGNICTASPAGDTLPPLYVLGATVELLSKKGTRSMSIDDFITGPGRTKLEEGEVLSAIWVRKPKIHALHHFEKVGLRNALACSVVSLAAVVCFSQDEDETVDEATLAWGSIGPTVVRCREAEAMLRGGGLTLEQLRDAGALVRKAVSPISDVRADADYRRTVAGNLLLRLASSGRAIRQDGSSQE